MSIYDLLQDASLKGDVTTLQDLLGRDPLLLHRSSSSSNNTSPILVASKLGHLQFVEEILRLNPSLAEELHPNDKSSPLHLASGNRHVEVVKALVSTNTCMCLARDVHGRNPAHVAAMMGHVDVLEELLKATPAAARERVATPVFGGVGGDTIIHLCVKCNQLEALWMVAKTVGDAGTLLNATDGDGNTILHIAVADKQLEIVRFLLTDCRVEKSKPNSNDLTAMDIFIQSNDKDLQLRFILEQAKRLISDGITKEKQKERNVGWVDSQENGLMVVASLIATMAFQAGLSPPGGVWQDDNSLNSRAGWAVMAQTDTTRYNRFVALNTVAFVSSMVSILVLVSGLRKGRFCTAFILTMMWVSIAAITWSYGIAVLVTSPKHETAVMAHRAFMISNFFVAGVMGLLILGYYIYNTPWTVSLLEKLDRLVKK